MPPNQNDNALLLGMTFENQIYIKSYCRIVVRMGLLKKAKEKAEEAAKKTGQAAEKVGKEGVDLGKKGAKELEETAKKVKKKL